MKTNTSVVAGALGALVICIGTVALVPERLWGQASSRAEPALDAPTGQPRPGRYEYVGIRYRGGDKVMVVLPDGTAPLLSELTKYQRPRWADDRVYNLTVAINYLAKLGYEPIPSPTGNPDKDDVWMRRPAAIK